MYTKEQLIAKFTQAKANHQKWLGIICEAYRYVTPGRDALNQIMQYQDQGLDNNVQVFNDAAPMANIKRANDLIRMLMPDNQRWGGLGFDSEKIKNNPLTKDDLVNAENAVYKYLGQSNLSQQCQDAFIDAGVSSGAIWLEDPTEKEPLVYQSVPGFAVMPEFYVGNAVRDLWYPFSVSGQYLLDSYPPEKLGTSLLAIIDGDPSAIFWISRGIIHDPDTESEGADKRKVWRVVDLIPTGQDKTYAIIYDEHFIYKKLTYFRDRVRPGEVIGRGPGIEILPTIRRLNNLERISDGADEIRAHPPTEVDEQKINLDMITNFAGMAVPKGTFGNSMQLPPSPEVIEKIRKWEMTIDQVFSVNPIGNLTQPVRTATEVSERIDSSRQNTTIDTSRYLTETSKPIFETAFFVLLELGEIPKSAEFKKIIEENPEVLIFSYKDPLGDIQKNNNMEKVDRSLQRTQQNFGPEAWASRYDIVNLVDYMNENEGLPLNVYQTGKETKDQLTAIVKKASQGPQAPNSPLPTASTGATTPPPLTQQGITI